MHEYTASDALRKHMYAVEIAMRAMAERAGEDPEALGPGRPAARLRLRALPQRRALAATEEHPAEGVRILAARGLPEPMQRAILGHANYSGVPRDTPMARALFAVDELCGLPGRLRPGAPVPEPPGSRGLQRQEEAQGQGVCPGREPGRRHPGCRGAGRSARRAHRLRARRAPTPRAGPGPRTRVTGPAADRRRTSRSPARINRAAGGRPVPGNQVELLIDGPDTYAAMLDAHRRTPPAGSISRTTSSGATPTGWRFAELLAARAREGHPRAGALRLARLDRSPRASSGGYLRKAGVEVRAFHPLRPVNIVTNFSRNHRKLVVADGTGAVLGGLCIGCEWTGESDSGSSPGGTPRWTSAGPRPRCWTRRSRAPGQLTGAAAARRGAGGTGARRRATAEVRVISGRAGPGAGLPGDRAAGGGQRRAALDHRRLPGGAAAALPGAARRGTRRRGRAAAGARLERPPADPQSLAHRLPRPAAERRADLRVGRPDAPRQDHRVRRPLGPDRIQQPQPVQPARELRAGRADRGSRRWPRPWSGSSGGTSAGAARWPAARCGAPGGSARPSRGADPPGPRGATGAAISGPGGKPATEPRWCSGPSRATPAARCSARSAPSSSLWACCSSPCRGRSAYVFGAICAWFALSAGREAFRRRADR